MANPTPLPVGPYHFPVNLATGDRKQKGGGSVFFVTVAAK